MKNFGILVLYLAFALPALADDFIVVVFDTSGSMSDSMRGSDETRMEVAKKALAETLSGVADTTHVGVLGFNGWVYDLGPVDRERLTQAIQGVGPGGDTPLYWNIIQGSNRLLEERQKQNNVGFYKLLVVTDGQASDAYLNEASEFGDGTYRPGALDDAISRGIVVDTIALDMDEDHALMTQINGTYVAGNDPDSIKTSLQRAVSEVGYGTDDSVAIETFEAVANMPDDFALTAIQALTEFRNHPVGELPPVLVEQEDGSFVSTPNPASISPQPSSGIGGFACIAGAVVATLFLAIVGAAVLCSSR